MVMPSAPPRTAKTAAAAGSGSWACRACRTVATWSMLTPKRTIVSRLCPRKAGHHVAVAAQFSTQDFESEKRQQYVHDLVEKLQSQPQDRNAGRHPEPNQQDAREKHKRSQEGGPGHVAAVERIEIQSHHGPQIVIGFEQPPGRTCRSRRIIR